MRTPLAATLLFVSAAAAGAQTGFVAIDVTAAPIAEFNIDDAATGYGEIAFRGGLVAAISVQAFRFAVGV